ncbi:MAG: aminopeptidase [Desulfohalobiaceae bacterium]|nr:aminopeptidase [Desulfohalobiaceae bacterium]
MSHTLKHTPANCWQVYSSQEQRKAISDFAVRYIDFITQCKTERETVRWIRDRAREAGFSDDPQSPAFYRVLKDKSIILVRRGRRPLKEGLRVLGAHVDTPRLDLKQNPLYETCDLALAKTHYYGGLRKHQWFSRSLALHGVVVTQDGDKVNLRIGEEAEDPVFLIPDLLPHLASQQNEKKLSEAFEGEKMNVILGNDKAETSSAGGEIGEEASEEAERESIKKGVLQLLYARYGLTEEDLFSAELQLTPADPARSVGLDQSLVGGFGQDDRVCVFCGLQALLQESDPEYTQMALFWDKEEIGSEGATSARSMFFEYTLQELLETLEPGSRLSRVLANSRALSADVHGGLDPDHQDLHDPMNSSKLGYGPVFCKFTGHRGKLGANDATAEYVAWLRSLLNSKGIPWQMAEIGKVDAGGGGTVAKHLAVYGMDIIDCGPSVLGMHSPFELTSKADIYATYQAFRAFLE